MISLFAYGARMSGVCAFIAGYLEYEHKTLLIDRSTTLILSHLPMRNRVHDN